MDKRSPAEAPLPFCIGVSLISCGVLLLEIALTRLFSFTIWHHFAYVTISVALLGFGAAGSVLAAFPRLLAARPARFLVASAGCAAFSLVASLTLLSKLPLDPLRILTDRGEFLVLLIYYLAVTVPFFCAGLCISAALTIAARHVSRVYFWDLAGAGTGCALAVPAIWWFGTPAAALASGVFFAAAAVLFAGRAAARAAVLPAVLCALALLIGPRLEFWPNSGKYLAKFLGAPGTEHLFYRWTPINRVDFVSLSNPAGSYATEGISASYRGPKPLFGMVSHDGEGCAVMYRFSGDLSEMRMFREHVVTAPYVLLERPRVLVIGLGGGADILNGLVNGAGSIVGVEINPVTVEIGKGMLADFNGGIFNRPDVRVVAAEGRNYLRSHSDRYDLIEINSVDTFAALSTGAYVLSESYLYTAEAMRDYLDHLEPGGIFAMATWDSSEIREIPRHNTRIVSAAREALLARGVTRPQAHVAVVASVGRHTFAHALVKNEPFTAEEIAKLESFADRFGFEIWQRPDRPIDGRPASTIMWGPESSRERLYRDSPFRLRATWDESPFFFNFAKWRTLVQNLASRRTATVETGQKVLLLMLVQAVLFSLVLIVGPIMRLRPALASASSTFSYMGYFFAVGLGFILLEISFIQRFSLFLGYPTYSLTVTLFSLLVFTGIGSYLSGGAKDPVRAARRLALGVGAVALGYLWLLPSLFNAFLGAPLAGRIGMTISLIAPLGLMLGGFFPHGIRLVRDLHPALVPWAWAANGCATVVGTIVAVIVAITWSFKAVTIAAALTYGLGALALACAGGRVPSE